ncbi:60S ribosomal protein L7 [Dimargaris xerosporica]|nr:60S ribosomal protein L7 [Dimargaris xerosporica]
MPATTVAPTKGQNPLPETVLKKRNLTEKQHAEVEKRKAEAEKKREASRKVMFTRAEQYVQEYKQMERQEIIQRRLARDQGNFYVSPEPKVLFVIRIKGIMKIPPKPKKILQLLRLRQINNGVFIRANKATLNMLQLVTPYVAFGEPNLKTIRELVYKRGFGKVRGSRLPLSDNSVIEDNLGKYGVICIEDIIHELYTCGPNFKQVSNFLWPFKLSNPRGGWATRKFKHFVEGGNTGNNEHKINTLVRNMN